jgi:2-polyprenyl-3-methyl-5-hydroxy-6-metoxy-1,4-benzoquinol methylase
MNNEITGCYQYEALVRGNPVQRQWHRNKIHLLNYLDFLTQNDILLDAGCGSGNTIFEFLQKVQYLVGIDCNEKSIDFVKQRIAKLRIKNVRVEKMNIVEVGSLNLKFDKIVMIEVIEHFSEEFLDKILAEMHKVINSDTKILITTPNYRSFWVAIETFLDTFNLVPKLKNRQHVTKYSSQKLAEIAERNRFEIICSGTLNWISPFAASLSQSLADKIAYLEFSNGSFGNLLYAVLKAST